MSKKPSGLRLAAGDGRGSLLQEWGSKSCSSISFASLLPARRCASLCHLLTGLTLCFLLDLFRSHSTRGALTLATAFRSHQQAKWSLQSWSRPPIFGLAPNSMLSPSMSLVSSPSRYTVTLFHSDNTQSLLGTTVCPFCFPTAFVINSKAETCHIKSLLPQSSMRLQ